MFDVRGSSNGELFDEVMAGQGSAWSDRWRRRAPCRRRYTDMQCRPTAGPSGGSCAA